MNSSPLQAQGSLFTELCCTETRLTYAVKLRFQFDKCVSAVFSDPRPHHGKGQKGGGTPLRSEKSRGLLWPAVGQSGLLLSFEQIQGLFIIENQARGAYRAMKEFIILHPTYSASPSASHPASLTAGSLARAASEHLGWAGGRLPRSRESQTTLHTHTYPSDWNGASKDGNGQLRWKLHETDILQAYLSRGLQRLAETEAPRGRPRWDLRPVSTQVTTSRPIPWAARPVNTAIS